MSFITCGPPLLEGRKDKRESVLRSRIAYNNYIIVSFGHLPAVEETEENSFLEWPRKNLIKLTFHDNKVEREKSLVVIASWVDTKTQLVAPFSRVEGWAVDDAAGRIASLGRFDTICDVVNFPGELAGERVQGRLKIFDDARSIIL